MALAGTDVAGSVGWGWQILGMLPEAAVRAGLFLWALPAAPCWFTALLIPSGGAFLVPGISGQDPLVLMDAQVPFPSLAAPLAP